MEVEKKWNPLINLLIFIILILFLIIIFYRPPKEEVKKIILPTIIPTSTITTTPTTLPTPTPFRRYFNNGDIGKKWISNYEEITLVSAYETEMIDGHRPFMDNNGGYDHGWTKFLVLEFVYKNISDAGNTIISASDFFYVSYSDDFTPLALPDRNTSFSSGNKKLYPNETANILVVIEIRPINQNINFCFHISGSISGETMKYTPCEDYSMPYIISIDYY